MTEALQDSVVRAQAQLHSVEWARQQLGLSRTKTYELIASGQLQSLKVGARRLIPESAIGEFIDAKMKVTEGGR